MKSTSSYCLSSFFFFVLFVAAAIAVEDSNTVQDGSSCVYTLYVKTGSVADAGTDSHISVSVGNAANDWITIPDLASEGIHSSKTYDFFERGNLDVFSVRKICITLPLCRINVTSDGTGKKPGWFLEYVEVGVLESSAKATRFNINQWLGIDLIFSIHVPFPLNTTLNICGKGGAAAADQGLDHAKVLASS